MVQSARKYYQYGIFLNVAGSIQPLSFAMRSVWLQMAESAALLVSIVLYVKRNKIMIPKKQHTEDR